MTENKYLLEGDDGEPLGVVDIEMITTAGCQLAFEMAANCADEFELERIVAGTIDTVGTSNFGFVATAAMKMLAFDILNPALTAGEAAGVSLRHGLRALAEGKDPGEADRAAAEANRVTERAVVRETVAAVQAGRTPTSQALLERANELVRIETALEAAAPQPDPIPPWTVDLDPQHPQPDDLMRYVLSRYQFDWNHDGPQHEREIVAASAVHVDCFGPAVELGPWSLSITEARVLARVLDRLANTAAAADGEVA
jgi:hypothetical protein